MHPPGTEQLKENVFISRQCEINIELRSSAEDTYFGNHSSRIVYSIVCVYDSLHRGYYQQYTHLHVSMVCLLTISSF